MIVTKILVGEEIGRGGQFLHGKLVPAENFGPPANILTGTMPTLVLRHRKGLLYSFVTIRPKFHGKLVPRTNFFVD